MQSVLVHENLKAIGTSLLSRDVEFPRLFMRFDRS